jgi:hypothetical protein
MLARRWCYISQINKITSRSRETLLFPGLCVEGIPAELLAVNGRTQRERSMRTDPAVTDASCSDIAHSQR